MATTIEIHGQCDPAFGRVRDAFARNFAEHQEVGAAVCVYSRGKPVVDLWAGVADPQTGRPWERDTLVCMMSVGKSVCALAVLMLVDRGVIDLAKPVAHYWPGFAQAGKAGITVRTLLSAQAALLYADHAPAGAAYDWEAMIRALELQAPEWEPGTRGAYHSMTFGLLLGELVRRADGRPIRQFVAEEIAAPLGIDYWFGLDDATLARVADIVPNLGNVTLQQSGDPSTKLGRAWRVQPRPTTTHYRNTLEFRRAVFPSANGHSNARSVARLYAMLANFGTLDGVRMLSPETVEIARTESWHGICGMTDRLFRYGVGFFLNLPPLLPFGPNPRAFGHPGAGGAIGVADPEAQLAFSYSPNRMCEGAGVGERCLALVEAVFGGV
jgi:CubicO group peptidase (beta-lactamase class C family)